MPGQVSPSPYIGHMLDISDRKFDQRIENIGVPKGIRTPVTAVKGRCPRPLDDGDADLVGACI